MTNETYLDMAKRTFRMAQKMYKYRSDDEGELNWIGFMLQQSIELALKHRIETMGKKPETTHDIADLLEQIDDGSFDELFPYSGTITQMEAQNRYIKNHRLAIRLVNQMMNITEGVLTKVEKFDNQEKEYDALETAIPYYLQVFPDFDDGIEILEGWYDSSDIKDESPSISKKNNNDDIVKIVIDYKTQSKRHPPRSMRFDLKVNEKHIRSFARWGDVVQAASTL